MGSYIHSESRKAEFWLTAATFQASGLLSNSNDFGKGDGMQHANMQRALEPKDVIRLLRSEVERAGSQAEFARKAGVDRATVNRILHGRLSALPPRIIRALDLRTVYLPK